MLTTWCWAGAHYDTRWRLSERAAKEEAAVDSRRERLATVIRAWSEGAKEIGDLAEDARVAESRAIDAALGDLRGHTSMVALAEAYLADPDGWPPIGAPGGGDEVSRRRRAVVAAAYWSRYQELLGQSDRLPDEADEVEPARPSRASGPVSREISHGELLYTIKLWQRGPLRLRTVAADRRPYYEALIRRLYARIADCRSTRELASRYYSDGEYVLQLAKEALQPLAEPISSIGWVRDAACWRRYQELLDESPVQRPMAVSSSKFALWLAGQMTRRRISVAELAYRLGTVEPVVRAWLYATDLPSQELVRQIASHFGLAEAQLPLVDSEASAKGAEAAEGEDEPE